MNTNPRAVHTPAEGFAVAFGPVPSRRLGRSLGINNIPPKLCSYTCIYCQLGMTIKMQVERQQFYQPETIANAVVSKVAEAARCAERIDYLTFVPDGEPTLDSNLGASIRALKRFHIPVAVITNASLMDRQDVREDLSAADWVSIKVDAVDAATWRTVDRPHGSLDLSAIMNGSRQFADAFSGTLVTETMLVNGVNDGDAQLRAVVEYLAGLNPKTAYLSVPTRPPAKATVRPPDEAAIAAAFAIFSGRLPNVEGLFGYEGNAFASSGDAEQDLLSITAVHPMREDAVRELLGKDGANWNVVERLLSDNRLVKAEYGGHSFYVRSLKAVRR